MFFIFYLILFSRHTQPSSQNEIFESFSSNIFFANLLQVVRKYLRHNMKLFWITRSSPKRSLKYLIAELVNSNELITDSSCLRVHLAFFNYQ